MTVSVGRPRILITGREGQLGWELARAFAPLGEVFAFDRVGLDLSMPDAIRARCREVSPSLILNAGGYTAVDKAESEPELARLINGDAPGILAEEANRLGAPLIHYSTDYVFDGNATIPYQEDDATAPQSVYGRTKLAGEQAVTAVAKSHLVLRTSWLYGNRRQNFFLTMLRLAHERDELRVVADQIGTPTWVRPVSEATAQCVTATSTAARISIPSGIYHLTAAGHTSWHGFASAILESTSDEPRRATRAVAISTADYPTPAKRPAYSVLSLAKLQLASGITPDDWRVQLAGCIAERKDIKP
ncbi:MAG: dTDP-4-dehydrorhamnose reductase [Betaproteobacteria bacterium]|nr:dTDP-4-dehydrorhamnose reductase [Betaproteobacteria bacterium]